MNYPKQKPVASLPDRVDGWLRTRNYVAAGNLGEQIAIRSMKSLGYDLLGGQDDFLGMVSEVLGDTTQDKPEDMIAIDPGGRLVTVNTKASLSARSCLISNGPRLRARIVMGEDSALGCGWVLGGESGCSSRIPPLALWCL